MGIRIDALAAAFAATREHEVPAMKDDVTVKLTVGQILDLLIGSAPGQLDTLAELAAALNDDADFAATVTAALAAKASLTGSETLTNKTLTAPEINAPTLTLKQSSNPTPTAEGVVEWDTDNNVLVVGNGTDQTIIRQAGPNLSAGVASTSGTAIDFTGIPSWVNRITVMFQGVSTNGTSGLIVQIGDSGGIDTAGYESGASSINGTNNTSLATSTTAFIFVSATVAASFYTGRMVLERINGNTWVSDSKCSATATGVTFYQNGSRTLDAVLDRLRISAGGNTFDAGTVNVSWE